MHTALSRRRFLRDSALFAGAAGGALPLLASAAERSAAIAPAAAGAMAPVMIGSNEFPDGPCAAAIKAITQIAPQGGRYLRELQMELMTTLAAELKLPVNHLMAYAGSTEPLDYTMLAFTSPSAALVSADPPTNPAGALRPAMAPSWSRCRCARTSRTTCRRCAQPMPTLA